MTCCLYYCQPCYPCCTPCCSPCYPCTPCSPCCTPCESFPKKERFSDFVGGGCGGGADDDDNAPARKMKRPFAYKKKKKCKNEDVCTPRAVCNCPKPKIPPPCCCTPSCTPKNQASNSYGGGGGYGQSPTVDQCRTCGMPKVSTPFGSQNMEICTTCGMKKRSGLTVCGTCGSLKPGNSMSPYQQFGGPQPYTTLTQMPNPMMGQMPNPMMGQMPNPMMAQMPNPMMGQMPYPMMDQMPNPMMDQMPNPMLMGQMPAGDSYGDYYDRPSPKRTSACSKQKKSKHHGNNEPICLNNPLDMITL